MKIAVYDDIVFLPSPAAEASSKAAEDNAWSKHPLSWIYGQYHCVFYKDTDKRKRYLRARSKTLKEMSNGSFSIAKHGGFYFRFPLHGNNHKHPTWLKDVSRIRIKL